MSYVLLCGDYGVIPSAFVPLHIYVYCIVLFIEWTVGVARAPHLLRISLACESGGPLPKVGPSQGTLELAKCALCGLSRRR